jgi:hypothetical protein
MTAIFALRSASAWCLWSAGLGAAGCVISCALRSKHIQARRQFLSPRTERQGRCQIRWRRGADAQPEPPGSSTLGSLSAAAACTPGPRCRNKQQVQLSGVAPDPRTRGTLARWSGILVDWIGSSACLDRHEHRSKARDDQPSGSATAPTPAPPQLGLMRGVRPPLATSRRQRQAQGLWSEVSVFFLFPPPSASGVGGFSEAP